MPRYVGHPETSKALVSFNNRTLLVILCMRVWALASCTASQGRVSSHETLTLSWKCRNIQDKQSWGGEEGGHLLNQALLRHRVWWKVIRRYQPCDYRRPVQTHCLLLILKPGTRTRHSINAHSRGGCHTLVIWFQQWLTFPATHYTSSELLLFHIQ